MSDFTFPRHLVTLAEFIAIIFISFHQYMVAKTHRHTHTYTRTQAHKYI